MQSSRFGARQPTSAPVHAQVDSPFGARYSVCVSPSPASPSVYTQVELSPTAWTQALNVPTPVPVVMVSVDG